MIAEYNPPLPQRILGRTGVELPILGLGTAPVGHWPYVDAVAFLHRCIDSGVTHWDTGPALGGFGNAQRILGEVLSERRDEVFLATKCWEPDGDEALRLLESNLKELRTDHADLVYAHSIGDDKMTPEKIYGANGICRALERARRDGLTRFVGVSGHNRPRRFLRAIQEWDFDVMMNVVSLVSRHYYGFEQEVWPVAAARGIGLVGMKVFGGVELSERSAKGALLPGELQQASLRYALGLPGVSGVVIGMLDEEELQQTLAWARTFSPLTAEELDTLEQPTRDLAAQWGEVYGPRD